MKQNLTIENVSNGPSLPSHVDPIEQDFQRIKSSIHQQLVEAFDLSSLRNVDDDELWQQVRTLAHRSCVTTQETFDQLDRTRLLQELMAELYGLGPIEPLMQDPTVSDILVNDPYTVYIERNGCLELTDVMFADDDHLIRIIQRVVARMGRLGSLRHQPGRDRFLQPRPALRMESPARAVAGCGAIRRRRGHRSGSAGAASHDDRG